MGMHNAASMIVDIRGAYDTNEIFGYREWTDAFIFERLLNIQSTWNKLLTCLKVLAE